MIVTPVARTHTAHIIEAILISISKTHYNGTVEVEDKANTSRGYNVSASLHHLSVTGDTPPRLHNVVLWEGGTTNAYASLTRVLRKMCNNTFS